MALPASYTEQGLAEYMRRSIEGFAGMYRWEVTEANGDYQDAVHATLRACGVTDIADVTNVRALEAYALVEVWRKVVRRTAADYTYSSDGQNFQRSDLYKQAAAELAAAQATLQQVLEEEDLSGGPYGDIKIGVIHRPDDPYAYNHLSYARRTGQ